MNEIGKVLNSNILSGFRATPEGHSGGIWVQKLEQAFKEYFGVKHAIALSSGTAGLHAAMMAHDIVKGNNVIVTPYSFSSSASCVLMVGATPVFVDIDERTFCLDSGKIERDIFQGTKAIIVVHLFGYPANMGEIMEIAQSHHLWVIEDAAQAIGAKYDDRFVGTIGDCGIFSFNQSKHINTGEGGMLITNDDETAQIVRAIRNHGEVSDPELKRVGFNYRLGEIEACLAYQQFIQLEDMIKQRDLLAAYLTKHLKKVITPTVALNCRHAWWAYPIRTKKRDKILKKLQSQGIACDKYVEPLYNLPIYSRLFYRKGMCPVAEGMWDKEMLRIDMQNLTNEDCKTIIEVVNDVA